MDPAFNELADLAVEDSIPDMSKTFLVTQQDNSAKEAPSRSSSQIMIFISCSPLSLGDDDVINFELPSLGAFHERVVSSSPLTPSTFRQIVGILYSEMAKSTLYPTCLFYSKVTCLLLEKYSQLRDVVGSGHDFWKVAICNKYKNLRRKLVDHADVLDSRKKFGGRKKSRRDR
ncbi:hypothetical protein HPB50_011844 [Hyalomma asiaticum]|uniref:Uncharacterized protein n=1 Tax=Hyalomma asiaticum TaxID=266040 RepID=A0ACB7TJ33_HYAAI|nr:hypothetical protein HPB50_011844 [Hyalomma asiaticum]